MRAETDLHVSRQTISGEHGLDGDGQYVERTVISCDQRTLGLT